MQQRLAHFSAQVNYFSARFGHVFAIFLQCSLDAKKHDVIIIRRSATVQSKKNRNGSNAVSTPTSSVSTPTGSVSTPTSSVSTPTSSVSTPTSSVSTPTSSVSTPTSSVSTRTSSVHLIRCCYIIE